MSDEWLGNFWKFYEDMGKRPTKKHQIDRINNNKGYSKDNCRWVTAKENARNRNNPFSEEDVKRIRLMLQYRMGVDVAKDFNVSPSTISKIKVGCHYKNYGEL